MILARFFNKWQKKMPVESLPIFTCSPERVSRKIEQKLTKTEERVDQSRDTFGGGGGCCSVSQITDDDEINCRALSPFANKKVTQDKIGNKYLEMYRSRV